VIKQIGIGFLRTGPKLGSNFKIETKNQISFKKKIEPRTETRIFLICFLKTGTKGSS
jgi:hypothetical protein